MPERLCRPCAAPNCRALVVSGYCSDHAAKAEARRWSFDERRGSAATRGYDAAWRRFRAWFLAKPEHATCEDCHKLPSIEVHHIKKVRDYPELRLVESNCKGLCKGCHSVRTLRGE